jgi:hypothetical protein
VRDGYYATVDGTDFEASPDGETLHLYSDTARAGFDEVAPGRFRRVVAFGAATGFGYLTTRCVWRGEPFKVLGDRGDWLRVEYTGGRAPVAERLGLERFDRGVYQAWAPAAEVTDVRAERV